MVLAILSCAFEFCIYRHPVLDVSWDETGYIIMVIYETELGRAGGLQPCCQNPKFPTCLSKNVNEEASSSR
jgi:hypothetical protein